MKKHRCPYCGEESITAFNKMLCNNLGKRAHLNKFGNPCPSCGQHYMVASRAHTLINILLLLVEYGVPLLLLILAFDNVFFAALFIVYITVISAFAIIPFRNYFFMALTQYDQENFRHILLDPNADVTLNTSQKIKHLDIFGIRFREHTDVVRFHETFTNDLVPVVFYKDKKHSSNELKVTVMKAQFVPEALLHEGAEFSVIDNGEEIATGVFTAVYPPDEE